MVEKWLVLTLRSPGALRVRVNFAHVRSYEPWVDDGARIRFGDGGDYIDVKEGVAYLDGKIETQAAPATG